tara:strand:- start:840 stop:965 length:126 start_codon:yes stop_codon:yes gene_type:complete
MASDALRTYNRRKNKKSKTGKKRKSENENKGTTPKFPIHKD